MTESAAQEILLGSLAGSLGKLVEYPFDTVKVKLQSRQYASTWSCLCRTWSQEGLRGFYRGLASPLVGASLENACLFYVYNAAQGWFMTHSHGEEVALSGKMAAGGLSGVCASFILTPVELVKCNMQVQAEGLRVPRSMAWVMGDIYRTGGVAGFWRGQLPTLIRELIGTALWFGTYEGVSGWFRARRGQSTQAPTPVVDLLASGAAAGVVYNTALYPVDTVKSNMQIRTAPTASMATVARHLYHTAGIRGFYRGLGITVLRCIPANAVIFFSYHKGKELLG